MNEKSTLPVHQWAILSRYSLSWIAVRSPAMVFASFSNFGCPNILFASTTACQSLRYHSRKCASSRLESYRVE